MQMQVRKTHSNPLPERFLDRLCNLCIIVGYLFKADKIFARFYDLCISFMERLGIRTFIEIKFFRDFRICWLVVHRAMLAKLYIPKFCA